MEEALKTKIIHSTHARSRRFNRKADKVGKFYKSMSEAIGHKMAGGEGLTIKDIHKMYA